MAPSVPLEPQHRVQKSVATPDPALEPPAAVLAEAPLKDLVPEIPDVFVVFREQPVDELAAYLKTTTKQLRRRNPGLADTVPAGTVVVIPFVYEAEEGESLSDVAAVTGLPEQELSAANPAVTRDEAFTAETWLVVPRLHIVYMEEPLRSAADELASDTEILLSANPALSDEENVRAGTVLVVPVEQE